MPRLVKVPGVSLNKEKFLTPKVKLLFFFETRVTCCNHKKNKERKLTILLQQYRYIRHS